MRPVTASEGIDLLTALGVNVLVRDADTVALTLQGKRTIARVHVRRSSPSRWDIQRDLESDRSRDPAPDMLLYVVPKATPRLTEAASNDPMISVVSVQDRVVFLAGEPIEDGLLRTLPLSGRPASARGRVAWGRFGLLRVLLRTPQPRTQIDLAFCGHAFGGRVVGQRILAQMGLSGIPTMNVENACTSGASAFHLAYQAVAHGDAELVLDGVG